MANITEEYVKELEAKVETCARNLKIANPGLSFKNCLEASAQDLCDGWDWLIMEAIGGNPEAKLVLTSYRGY